MISDNHGDIAPLVPLSAQARDAILGAEDRFRRGGAEGADGFRPDALKLAEKELPADFHLVRLGSAVFGRAALHYIADVDVLALQGDALFVGGPFDHLRQKLSGPA